MWALLNCPGACSCKTVKLSRQLCQSVFAKLSLHSPTVPSRHSLPPQAEARHQAQLAWTRKQHCRLARPSVRPGLAALAMDADAGSLSGAEESASIQHATGKVISQDAKFFRVRIDAVHEGQGEQQQHVVPPREQLLCLPRGLLRKMGQRVLVGDLVEVSGIDWTEGRGVVENVMKRSNVLIDPAIANVDHVVLLFALSQPPFEELQVSRFLVSIEAEGLPLSLVLNKCDTVTPEVVEARLKQCRSWGYEALPISCSTGEGLDTVVEALGGRTSVLAGPSGSGKSSLINALRVGRHRADAEPLQLPLMPTWPSDADLEAMREGQEADLGDEPGCSGRQPPPPGFLTVGEMSRVGRGTHTTRSVSLITLPGGGLLADSPGFSQPSLEAVGLQQLGSCFPEFRAATEGAGRRCRFDNCLHMAEPGCAVVEAGLERWEHYARFATEIQVREQMDEKFLQSGKRQREGNVKTKSGRGGKQRFEVRLDARKHRRMSRSKENNVMTLLDDDFDDSGLDSQL